MGSGLLRDILTADVDGAGILSSVHDTLHLHTSAGSHGWVRENPSSGQQITPWEKCFLKSLLKGSSSQTIVDGIRKVSFVHVLLLACRMDPQKPLPSSYCIYSGS